MTTAHLAERRKLTLSVGQAKALRFATRDAVSIDEPHAFFGRRDGVGLAQPATIKSLVRAGLLRARGVSPEEWVPTADGLAVARANGVFEPFKWKVLDPRARAMHLRNLTLPDIQALGEPAAYDPPRLGPGIEKHFRWIEVLGYGDFVREVQPRFGYYVTLVLTAKGRELVSATDMPLKVRLSSQEETNLRSGQMQYAIVPDAVPHKQVNFQIVDDRLGSPRDLYARLWDSAAIFPGTRIDLVREDGGARVGSARAGNWDRIALDLLPYGSDGKKTTAKDCWHFDATFEYNWRGDDGHGRWQRVWAPFPEDYELAAVRPKDHALRFAAACGFDDLRSMRTIWLTRALHPAVQASSDVRGWVKGLMVELRDIELR